MGLFFFSPSIVVIVNFISLHQWYQKGCCVCENCRRKGKGDCPKDENSATNLGEVEMLCDSGYSLEGQVLSSRSRLHFRISPETLIQRPKPNSS